MWAKVRARTDVLRVAPNATVTGWLSREEVLEKLRKARALVFPSLWYETMGLVVAEAAALGVPAIVADTSAAAELVEHNQTGLLFRGGDTEALAEAVNRLCDPVMASRLGEGAYHRYWTTPTTLENHLDQLEPVYRQALSGPA